MNGIHCMLQDYIQSIGSCLLQIGGATEGPIVDVMHKLTDESSQLLGCIKLLNLKVHEAMLHGELDPTLAKSQSMTQYYSSSVVGLLANSLCNLPRSLLPCACLFLFCIPAYTCYFRKQGIFSNLGTCVCFICNRAQHYVCRCSCSLPTSSHGTLCVRGAESLTYKTALMLQSVYPPAIKSNASLAAIYLSNYCTCSSRCSTKKSLNPPVCALCAHDLTSRSSVSFCFIHRLHLLFCL